MNRRIIFIFLFSLLFSCQERVRNNTPNQQLPIKEDTIEIRENEPEPISSQKPEKRSYSNINALVDSMCWAINNNDLEEFIRFCDPWNYDAQKSMGMEDDQYVYEILMLRYESDAPYPEVIDLIMRADKTMQIDTIMNLSDDKVLEYFVTGSVNFSDTLKLPFELPLIEKNQQLVITGGVG